MRRPLVFTSPRQRAERFAEEARRWLNTGRSDLKGNCWQTAIQAAREGKAISADSARRLLAEAVPDKPERFAPASCYAIESAEDMRNVAPGCFVVFIGDPYTKGGPGRLTHVMVSLGGGEAAGSNNDPVGGSPAWSRVDLAAMTWTDNRLVHGGRKMTVRVRDIQDHDRSCVVM